ncbi:TetR family transcriptional regulator [Corynebacterium striatum]|uniref:TetR/AcrR family transcriptional regulator n=1 Tax=Corynebacterium striatum TaxID=43770 RepID=A0ABC8CP81_CORST|nr:MULTISPECIES: TetR/AcrR family transcriptional regulator [Corynebacterium]ATZ09763.1 TetR/AcrR family transcriptional regulator [Corynebacterium striatum]EGT5576564.1 TetR/AcrR family transcriptional regulator [Corynebacterium striatum]EGT5592467.1 TetR/AcrR family transcriptional regulator [Corynebacterium striatum]EGT5613232.1 TetR/AcrR family transcriptional regulator [Corynebacterium striatum]KAA1265145.1 TetR/AcrR family transcriptional regulator [Corynebacterium striatum]
MVRQRMTGRERREQLIVIGRAAFAELGFDGASVEEIAARAGVSKPVVYEHFGGKEGLYAVIVDREMLALEEVITHSLSDGTWRERIEKATVALLNYVEQETDGFLILVRDSKPGDERSYSTLLNSSVGQVSYILGSAFERRGLDAKLAGLYAQALVGMVSMTAQWWLDTRQPAKEVVAAHIVNLCWNGLSGMEAKPKLRGTN